MFKCNCEICGAEKLVKEKRSMRGMCRGCAARIAVKQRYKNGNCDGRASDPVYFTWRDMFHRCTKTPAYIRKDIKVCDEWRDFYVFREWANSNGAKKGLHMDRINSNKGYYPENCRFISGWENSKRVNGITKVDIELVISLHKFGKNLEEIYEILSAPKNSSSEMLSSFSNDEDNVVKFKAEAKG